MMFADANIGTAPLQRTRYGMPRCGMGQPDKKQHYDTASTALLYPKQ